MSTRARKTKGKLVTFVCDILFAVISKTGQAISKAHAKISIINKIENSC